ncbi:MAG: hypothetical protein RL130_1348 [Actinomycetota bacterium]|jgi:uncharacterized RDD family membrane protein YckC
MYPRVSQGRRIVGITIDWLACYAIALGFFAGGGSLAERVPEARLPVLILLFAEYSILVALGGSSFGHRLVGLKVVRFTDGGQVTPVQALIRTALLLPIITAITFDENGRGINERFSNTVLIKTRS